MSTGNSYEAPAIGFLLSLRLAIPTVSALTDEAFLPLFLLSEEWNAFVFLDEDMVNKYKYCNWKLLVFNYELNTELNIITFCNNYVYSSDRIPFVYHVFSRFLCFCTYVHMKN